jgi:3-hydroxyisobutyrate dehydrogenase-like beta-hydroxyacid dehydrogenase
MVPADAPKFPVGFIGLGDQGLPIAVAIANAGYPLHVWDRRLASLDELGPTPHVRYDHPASLAAACEVVALCVSTDDDVFQVVESGVLTGLRRGGVIVNHGTGTPQNAVRLQEQCAAAGIDLLDAPVSGGRAAAEQKALVTMVGGPRATFERCEPLFRSFSGHVFHLGGVGAGQAAKLLNNTLMVMNQAGIVEIVGLATAFDLDPVALVDVLKQGSASSRVLTLMDVGGEAYKNVSLPVMEARLSYLKLDMEIFAQAAAEEGVDVSAIAERGMTTVAALPAFLKQLATEAAARKNLSAEPA